jgi:hypothetical protein
MRIRKLLGTAAAAAALIASPAIAGTTIKGYGSSREAAIRDANEQARQASYDRFQKYTCYTPAKPSTCGKDSEGWVCDAAVANHAGSC